MFHDDIILTIKFGPSVTFRRILYDRYHFLSAAAAYASSSGSTPATVVSYTMGYLQSPLWAHKIFLLNFLAIFHGIKVIHALGNVRPHDFASLLFLSRYHAPFTIVDVALTILYVAYGINLSALSQSVDILLSNELICPSLSSTVGTSLGVSTLNLHEGQKLLIYGDTGPLSPLSPDLLINVCFNMRHNYFNQFFFCRL